VHLVGYLIRTMDLLFPGESYNVLETSYYSETSLCWPPLVPFKAAQLLKVASSRKPLVNYENWTVHYQFRKCVVQSTEGEGRVGKQVHNAVSAVQQWVS